jgi:hypothetical protein
MCTLKAFLPSHCLIVLLHLLLLLLLLQLLLHLHLLLLLLLGQTDGDKTVPPRRRVKTNEIFCWIQWLPPMEENTVANARAPAADADGDSVCHNEVPNNLMQRFADARDYPFRQLAEHPVATRTALYLVLFLMYNAYLVGCVVR